MNQHTAKQLKAYARVIGKDARQVKKWWDTLDWKQRTAWRLKIDAILEEVETVNTEETVTTEQA